MILIALGSNLPYRGLRSDQILRCARDDIARRIAPVERSSKLYRSTAWPNPKKPCFYNAAIALRYGAPADRVMRKLLEIEERYGRKRGRGRNTARTLDLDLITWHDVHLRQPGLTLPHPRAVERVFVMQPLSDIVEEGPWARSEKARRGDAKAVAGADWRVDSKP
jgi:2-amino-4-hydroxy-6-hydroxymethyldihydropteridine diphosphokinase